MLFRPWNILFNPVTWFILFSPATFFLAVTLTKEGACSILRCITPRAASASSNVDDCLHLEVPTPTAHHKDEYKLTPSG